MNYLPIIKGVRLPFIDLLTYKEEGRAIQLEPGYRVKCVSYPMTQYRDLNDRMNSVHITFALAFPNSWFRGYQDPEFKRGQEMLPDGTSVRRSLTPGSPELYATKEVLESRLRRRTQQGYKGKALTRFDPEIERYSGLDRLARLVEFEVHTRSAIKAQTIAVPDFGKPRVGPTHHDGGQRCDICRPAPLA